MLSSHLAVLDDAAARYPFSPAFRTPQSAHHPDSHVQLWHSITYRQFKSDVEAFARYWAHTLDAGAIPQRSVVGLWLAGLSYTDVLHVYGLSRAGYIPQLFSLRLPSPQVIFELLEKANAKALIFDPSFESVLNHAPLPVYLAVAPHTANALDHSLPNLPVVHEHEIAFVFHTSGSTSGSPKLVPCTYRWLSAIINKANQVGTPRNPDRQDVTVWMGSMCHIGQTFMLMASLQHGSCVVQPTKISFSSDELADMIHQCGLNRLNQFGTFLSTHLRNSRHDPKLLSLLSNLDEVLYSGLPLPREDEEWAHRNGIKLRNLFGSTECGAMLISNAGSDPLLRPLEGVSYGFVPIAPAPHAESGHQSTARMLELVILADSADCPHPSLRHSDGHFHTGDLFQEAAPGAYVFRGRDDDWIKTENSLRCDTKAIEDNVRSTCGNLIEDCIVVGTGRPSPVMFVELAEDMDHNKLKKEIIRKTRHFHSRRYLHERITSTNMIVIVPPKTLPRTATKGNIRRKAVEEAYKPELDRIFGVVR